MQRIALDYFHEITPGVTKLPLEGYNGIVAYVGQKEDENINCIEYKYKKHDERIEKSRKEI